MISIFASSDQERLGITDRLQIPETSEADFSGLCIVLVSAIDQFPTQPAETTAVLWVPSGYQPLPFDQWSDRFACQLQEDSEQDCLLLRRLGNCPRVLSWAEAVNDVPQKWFAQLSTSPRELPVTSFPFDAAQIEHLTTCPDCHQVAVEELQTAAELYWGTACPSADIISQWLDGAPSLELQRHVSSCGMCRSLVLNHARLWEAAGLVSPERAATKLVAAGIMPVPDIPRVNAAISATLAWGREATEKAIVGFATVIANAFSRNMTVQSAMRSSTVTPETPAASFEDAIVTLRRGEPIVMQSDGRWIHLMIDDDTLLIRAGRSSAERFSEFTTELAKGEDRVFATTSVRGVCRIRDFEFELALSNSADSVRVIESPPDSTTNPDGGGN